MGNRRMMSALTVTAVLIAANAVADAQTVVFDRNVIFLDPAHGGADSGGTIGPAGGQTPEKNVTLAFAAKLRPLLEARRFALVMSRTGDLDGGSVGDRAQLANRSHAVACLVVHASESPTGVVLGTSGLGTTLERASTSEEAHAEKAVTWDRAQEPYLVQSVRLARQVGGALSRASIATTVTHVVMKPLDNVLCPVILVELGTLQSDGGASVPASDDGYQGRVAASVAEALEVWRKEAQPVEFGLLSPGGTR